MIEVNVSCMCFTWLYSGVAPLEVEAQHGDAELVNALRIDFAISVLVGDHFAAAGEADVRAELLVDVLLQLLPVALMPRAGAVERAQLRHAEPPPISM